MKNKAELLANRWTEKWKYVLTHSGKKVSKEGEERYRDAMERLALIVVSGTSERGITHVY